jgi:hypothetical protein
VSDSDYDLDMPPIVASPVACLRGQSCISAAHSGGEFCHGKFTDLLLAGVSKLKWATAG